MEVMNYTITANQCARLLEAGRVRRPGLPHFSEL